MRPTAVAFARLIRFRHGRCNAGNAQATSAAAPNLAPKPPAAASSMKSSPASKPKAPHVVKPLGPNVTIQTLGSVKELPVRFRRPAFSAEEMTLIDLGGAFDPPPPPAKKDKKK
eukprot:CAMPEP_0181323182 /NCGR_PEP_ID=MMETSP1101-20121128/19638_1 /TAXON_ID=46948 /ORGANISM="Rhodomonas abbreviata, Strain Caron Lab Isolate" /LENGTH=113 /DNA_ID=CAMNT_0023431171 /DNA_START=31 /DNA_END=372 /DNA_ORIENTATION=+